VPHHPAMIRGPLRSITAAVLVIVLGILHTGVPSHSHDTDQRDARQDGIAIRADSHSHGVILLDAAERVPATGAQLPVPAVRIDASAAPAPERLVHLFGASPLRPSERGPPPAAPRAPPQLT
jgi:hypothetical protein